MFRHGKDQILSNTYLYGATWDGEILLQGRLTTGSLFNIAKKEKEGRNKREKFLEIAKPRAVGGFELAMQLITVQGDLNASAPIILSAWTDYIAHTKKYAQLNEYRHTEGVHIVLIGWYGPDGALHLKTNIALHDRKLTADQVSHVCKCTMSEVYHSNPHIMPPAYVPIPTPSNSTTVG